MRVSLFVICLESAVVRKLNGVDGGFESGLIAL
jgi:hypothetical protein